MPNSETTIPWSVQHRIYRLLSDEFGFDAETPMAAVAPVLTANGVDKDAFGFSKLKLFLAEMDVERDGFLAFTDIVAKGIPQRLVSVRRSERWEAGASAQEAPKAQGEAGLVAADPAYEDDPAFPRALVIAFEAATSRQYADSPVSTDLLCELGPDFDDFAHVPFKHRSIIDENLPAGTDTDALMRISWNAAWKTGALRCYEGKVVFPLAALRADESKPIEVSLRRGDPERSAGKPWHVCYVDTYVKPEYAQAKDAPSKQLEQFAWLGPWEEFLSQLAAAALPEAWDFGSPDEHGHRLTILKSYICTTFFRLQAEGKVLITEDRSFAAFNTGLVDNRFDDIYACFEPGPQRSTLEWTFIGFAASGNRSLKKRVGSCFNPLPQAACYFDRLEDMLFDPGRTLIVDYDHILLDNLARLPLAFLTDEMRASDEALGILDEIRTAAPEARRKLFDNLADIVDDDARLFRQLRNRLEDAVNMAKRRVRWNFKTAIPCYFPREDSMSLLLPLCLTDELHADAALVVQLQPSGNYLGQTVFTMKQAYMDARLICRPDSDWLNPLLVEDGSDDADA